MSFNKLCGGVFGIAGCLIVLNNTICGVVNDKYIFCLLLAILFIVMEIETKISNKLNKL